MKLTIAILLTTLAAAAQGVRVTPAKTEPSPAVDRLLSRIVESEHQFLASLAGLAPLFETYIQETASDPASVTGDRPTGDHYFLGRVRVREGVDYEPLIEKTFEPPEQRGRFLGLGGKTKPQGLTFIPRGFAQMAVIDLHGFDRTHYAFEFVRREFLGDIRSLVFDLSPIEPNPGSFVGRIWVEEQSAAIVRFNGTYVATPPSKNEPPEVYFHFDSWRTNPKPGLWVPSHIYVEEERPLAPADKKGGDPAVKRFKAITRAWAYAAAPSNPLDELTEILIENESQVRDTSASHDVSPLESQRAWERQAEENVLTRLEKGGFLAPPSTVDDVLDTVVNNLIVSNKLSIEAHCRVLLTTPIETFSIGHTIVISRGLIDVLPDETSLALVLAAELSHIALGHRTPTQFAFNNQTMLSDAELLQQLRFERSSLELDQAGAKTIEIMRASPYQKTGNAGLFLKAMASRSSQLPRLLAANLGNQLANTASLARLAEFTEAAPELEEQKLEQIAALPLGSRVKLNPYNDQITLVETKPIALLSAREKMPFEITPFVPYLTLAPGQPSAPEQSAAPSVTRAQTEQER